MSQSRIVKNIWKRDRTNGYIFPYNITDKIGIGTSTPSTDFDVNGDVKFINAEFTGLIDGVTSDGIQVGSDLDEFKIGLSLYRSGNFIGGLDNSGGDFRIKAQNSNAVQVINDGNIGIQITDGDVIDVVGSPTMSTSLQGLISHTNITDIGTNTHAQIDNHIADTTIHFTEGSIDHGSISGLLDDDHTQYALLSGRSGGQTLIGGTASGNNLTIQSTSNATKGKIIFGSNSAYDEINDRLGIGTTSPSTKLDVIVGTENARIFGSGTSAQGLFHLRSIETDDAYLSFAEDNVSDRGGIGFDAGSSDMEFKIGGDLSVATTKMSIGTTETNIFQDTIIDGSVKVGDDTDTCDATKVGALRYRTSGNNSYCDMCMQTGAATYAWNNIVQNNW